MLSRTIAIELPPARLSEMRRSFGAARRGERCHHRLELVRAERLVEARPPRLHDAGADVGAKRPGHEHDAIAEPRAGADESVVKLHSVPERHEHVAQDHVDWVSASDHSECLVYA